MKFGLLVFAFYAGVTLLVFRLWAFLLLLLAILVVALGAYYTRDYRRRQESLRILSFLQGLKTDRRLQQQEATRIWQGFVLQGNQTPQGAIIRGTLEWRVLDFDVEGSRLLVAPARPELRSFDALVGVDFKTRQTFFMVTPPGVGSVRGAMEYLWKLPLGSFKKERILEV